MNRLALSKRPGWKAGFTMIELLAVIAVIIALVGMVVAGAATALRAADKKKALKEIHSLNNAVEEYKIRQLGYYINVTSRTPMTNAPFRVLTNYNASLSFTDPWGGPYYYQRTGKEKFQIISYGPDARINTPDDVLPESSDR